MRVLLACSMGGAGHLLPVMAAARAFERDGHDASILVPSSLARRAAETGLRFLIGEQPQPAVIKQLWERLRQSTSAEGQYLMDRELFAQRANDAMLAGAEDAVERLRPRLIVREPCEYASAIVAYRREIGQAQVGISRSCIERDVLAHVAPSLEERAGGVADRIAHAPYLTSFPRSSDPSPWADTRRYRHRSAPRRSLPANTHIERWVQQDDVFQAAALVVCHGGSGTVFGALGAGVPLVICPLFADQTANARLVESAGAGMVFRSPRAADRAVATIGSEDVAGLQEAINVALEERRCRDSAQQIAREMAGAPALEDVLHGLTEDIEAGGELNPGCPDGTARGARES